MKRPQGPSSGRKTKGRPGGDKSRTSGVSGHARRRAERKRASGRDSVGQATPSPLGTEPVRLNRYIARSGHCSRREADALISAGQVKVNGVVVTELGSKVEPGDRVEVGTKRLSPLDHVYLLMNKPTDVITTTDDDRGRRTVVDLLDMDEKTRAGLFPIGRLDRDTTGVLLLTNDGDLAHRLMHPSFQVEKLYRVRTHDPVKPHELDRLRDGVELDDGPASADDVAYVALPDQHEVGLSIHEGRNRLVRRMFESLGHRVEHLERVRYAGLTTEGVRRGHWRRLDQKEVARLYRLVKLKS